MDGDEIVEETGSLENDGESKSNPVQEFQITFTVRLQLAFIKILKTIYTPITDISFKLINCISINNTMHLYAAGDVLCYHWWQVVIMVVVVPGLVVFPFSYGLAMCLIRKRRINTQQFLAAAAVPYYSMFLFVKSCSNGILSGCHTYNDYLFTVVQLGDEDEVYRQKHQILSWPVLQLYRSLFVAAIKSFVINPIYRTLMFLLAFFIFVLHDRSAKPFKNKNMNILHASCTICLSFIAMCNLMFSFTLYVPKVYDIDNISTVLKMLSIVEYICYSYIPCLVLWLLFFGKLKND